jgi:predicted DNA-binding ribbon-helix-helix protein
LTLPAHAVHDGGMARVPKQGTIQPQTRRGRKTAVVHLEVEKWRELKVIAARTDGTLDKLLQEGADLVIEKFRRTHAT